MQHDLERRLREKLRLWVRDGEELFDAGRLSSGDAHQAIIQQLMFGLVLAIVTWTRDAYDKEIVETFRRALINARGKKR